MFCLQDKYLKYKITKYTLFFIFTEYFLKVIITRTITCMMTGHIKNAVKVKDIWKWKLIVIPNSPTCTSLITIDH